MCATTSLPAVVQVAIGLPPHTCFSGLPLVRPQTLLSGCLCATPYAPPHSAA